MNKQSGAVSLFVVVFFMLLVTVVTVSFLRLMIADQQQASNDDLSQSAYDSAQAGVEDAKRKLLEYKSYCSSAATMANCGIAADEDHLSSPVCNAALVNGVGANATTKTDEVLVQQTSSTNDSLLNQAYTCVTIQLNTEDFVGSIAANKSQIVPLTSVSAFNRVKVEWFSKEDISTSASGATLSLDGVSSSNQPLKAQGQWPLNRPSLMRAQLMQIPNTGTFTMASFDTVAGANSNGATMFLYPTSQTGIPESIMTTYDQRRTTTPGDEPNAKDPLLTPTPVTCLANLNSGGYACSNVLVVPQAVGATTDANRYAFLRLTAFYNATHFRVTLYNGPVGITSIPVFFKDVQPLVDSTGRANDLFRRVQSRVDLFDTTFPYPEAAIEVTGNFCKDFAVTDTQYIDGSSACKP